MKRTLIYIWASNGNCLVLREADGFDVHAWFASRVSLGTFKQLGVTKVEWEVI